LRPPAPKPKPRLQGLGLGTLNFTKDAQGRVTGVKIDGATPLLDTHLAHFAAFPELRSLLISHAVKLSGKGSTSLSKLTKLEEFQAGGTRCAGRARLSMKSCEKPCGSNAA